MQFNKNAKSLVVVFSLIASLFVGCGKGGGGGGGGGGTSTATVLSETAKIALPSDASVIDKFDRADTGSWKFWTHGAGSAGAVEVGPGYEGSGSLSLKYNLTCATSAAVETCGQYVSSIINFSSPIEAGAALTFVTKSAPNIQVVVRVIDQSGQTLQYQPSRTLAGYDGDTWYPVTIALNKPAAYWGGANNGVVQSQIKSIWIIASNLKNAAISGTLSIDRLAMLNTWTAPGPVTSTNQATTIDNFENRATIAPWRFWGEGGVGATGSVDLNNGYESSGALALNYNLSCATVSGSRRCGQYATGILSLPTPVIAGAALSFMTKSAPNMQLVVRLIDQSGQTLQYRPARTANGNDPQNWVQTVINLSKPEAYWGGKNNGVVQTSIKAIWILAADAPSFPATGTLLIDNIVMLDSLENPPAGNISGAVSIDDFQNRASVSPWAFFNSGGTGVTGSISNVTGYGNTRGLALNYDMSCVGAVCGKSAAATFVLPEPVFAGAAISIMTKSPSSIQLVLRVIDQSGQTLQYRSIRPMDGYNPATWYRAVFELNKPESYWGGKNNGIAQGAVNTMWLVADNPSGTPMTGTISFDNLVMLSQWTAPGPIAVIEGVAGIDDFDSRPQITPWAVWSEGGSGAVGSVTATTGFNSSRALSINYNFTCLTGLNTPDCGQYVAATLSLPQQAGAGAAISFKAKSPAEIQVSVRVIDQSGQTLQYRVERPLEGYMPSDWYQVLIPLNTPQSFWGGANNGVVQGGINSIWIIAGDTSVYPMSGAVTVDDLAILSSIDGKYVLNAATTPLVPLLENAESIGSRIGVSYNDKNPLAAFDAATSAGVSFIRADLFWDWVETTKGAYNFAAFDKLVASAESRGLGVLFILAYGNPFYNVKTPAGVTAYANFAYAAAARYAGRNVKFEIWNEPDGVTFWGASADPVKEYVTLCNAATAAIKSANPAAKVTTGGLGWFNFDYLKQALTLGMAKDVEAVGIHGYRMGQPETIVNDYVKSNWWMQKLTGKTLPIWLTEWGYSVGVIPGDGHSAEFRKQQAIMLSRQMLSQWILGMEKAVWFDLVDGGTNPKDTNHNYGLLDASYAEKPSIQSLRTLTSMTKGQKNKGLVADAPAGLHIMKLDNSGKNSFIAWNSLAGSNTTIDILATGITSIVNYVGTPITGKINGNRMTITLNENDGPIYIRY